jgi:hypothetical protein
MKMGLRFPAKEIFRFQSRLDCISAFLVNVTAR